MCHGRYTLQDVWREHCFNEVENWKLMIFKGETLELPVCVLC